MGEVLERPMDSGAHIEVEAVPKSDGGEQQQGTPYQSDGHAMLSQAPIEVAPIDSVTVAREYAWGSRAYDRRGTKQSSLGRNIRETI